MQKVEINGEEVEVFTQAELQEQIAAKETEFVKTREQIEKERDDARKALAERTEEFGHANLKFKQLNAEQVAQLSEKERLLYENQAALQAEREKLADINKRSHEAAVTAAIRSKVGADEDLFKKVKGMYDIITLDDTTPDQIAARVAAAAGAIGGQQPDMLASLGIIGMPTPPKAAEEDKSFADTPEGKAIAADLGLIIEEPKQ